MRIVRELVEYYCEHLDEIPASYRHDEAPALTQVIDYVAGMTDRFAIHSHTRLVGGDTATTSP